MANDPNALLQKLEELAATDDVGRLPRPFGPYLLLAALARGGMGEVFLARSGAVAGFEKHCVVKTLRPHLTDDREYVARFIDEARVVVQLGHKNICQVFDVGRVGERYYLAMEQIAGKDLRTVVDAAVEPVPTAPMSSQRMTAQPINDDSSGKRRPPALDDALVIHVMGEVLEALDYAHRFVDISGKPLHLVHRDVSPQNVMVSWEGEVKLIDFGLAASTVKLEQTSPNVVMGKLAYMPPEQIRAEKIDPRADLFSAAVMLTEMVTGERFYQGMDSYAVWNLAAKGNFRPRRFDKITPSLQAILDKALQANPADRYATCADLREELMNWRQRQGTYADAATLRRLMHDRFAEDIKAHRALLAGISSSPSVAAGLVPEASKSFARATSLVSSLASESPVEEKTVSSTRLDKDRDPTEPTTTVPPKRRSRLIFGVAAGVVVGVGAFIGFDAATRIPVAPVAPVAVVTPVPPLVAPVVAEPVVPVVPVVTDVDDAALEPVAIDDTDDPDEDVPSLPNRPKKKKPVKKPETTQKAPETPETPAKTPEKTPEKKPEKPWNSLTQQERVDLLAARCPAQSCVAPLAANVGTWAAGSPAEMSQFRRDVEACHKACGP